LKGMK